METQITRMGTQLTKMVDELFAGMAKEILDYKERRRENHCDLEENKDSHDPRFDHADKLMDITPGDWGKLVRHNRET